MRQSLPGPSQRRSPRRRPLAVGPLRAFEAVARRLAFGAAANELHLQQPAVRQQIKALNDEVGAALFHRGTRRVELTGAGAALLRTPADFLRHTLLEEDDHRPSAEYLSWRHWLKLHAGPGVEPQGWLYLNYTYQQIQAALSGQGIALARWALVGEAIERGELVEPFGAAGRVTSPFAYWLVRWPARRQQPEVRAFEAWLLAEAGQTQASINRARDSATPLR